MFQLSCIWTVLFLTPLAWTASMRLPSFPLAVKTPYLSVWMPGHLSHDFPSATPQFWRGQELTWFVLAHIGEKTFCLLGCPGGRPGTVPAIQKSINFTSTHTFVHLEADSIEITLDFFSPVDPHDHVRQSLPYSYLTVSARRDDVTPSTVGILTGIDASWLSSRGEAYANYEVTNGSQILMLNGAQSIDFAENVQMALWGDVVLASKDDSKASISSCQVGPSEVIIDSFADSGHLTSVMSTSVKGSVAACAQSMTSNQTTSTATFAIGLHQHDQIQYFNGTAIERYAGYFRSKVSTVSEAVQHFFDDYESALAQSKHFDNNIRRMGESFSSNYSDLLEFSVRQSFGGQQVTIPSDTLDTSMPYSFIKEISTDGNVNTLADLIPKALPIFHVLNPEYTRMMLEPVLRFSKHAWPLNHAAHDIGKSYPNATGEDPCIEEFLPLDSTTVLLWMIYLHQRATGNTEMRDNYSEILQRYADYAAKYGLYPVLQRSSVDSIGSATNQSALSISAAIALNAYGKMTRQSNYSDLGLEYASKIVEIGTDSNNTHFLAHYGDEDESWVTTYPLAFDALLGLETFNSSVLEMQSDWYSQHAYPFGVQFNHNVKMTLMEFQMWAAAVSSDKMRDHIIRAVHMFYNQTTGPLESVPGPTQWRVTPGKGEGLWTHFSRAKSVVGSIFMVAAVQNASGVLHNSVAPTKLMKTAMPLDIGSLNVEQVATPTSHNNTEAQILSIPYDVPIGASRPVDRSFLGLSFDTAYFPTYLGNLSAPNTLSRDLIYNLIDIADAPITIRIGSPAGDHSVFNSDQELAVERVRSDHRSLSIGPSFFESIKVLGRPKDVQWAYQVPFISHNISNAVQGAQKAMEAIPLMQLFALEIGHEPNLYAGGSRPEYYDCQHYAAELFEYKVALRNNIRRISSQFQALGLSSDHIDDSWGLEECFTAGIDSQNDLKSVSVHYSQLGSASQLDPSNIPRHSAIQRKHKNILPHANYVRDVFPCFPFVISEASLVSTANLSYDTVINNYDDQASVAIAVWNLDFLLYSLSQNISRVFMHQSCDLVSSAWFPKSCRKIESGSSAGINGPYYALTFVAAFLKGAKDFRVATIQESDDTVVYAGYESGKLSRIAIVNYPPSESMLHSQRLPVEVAVPPEVKSFAQVEHVDLASIRSASMRLTSTEKGPRNMNQAPLLQEPKEHFQHKEGVLSVSAGQAGVLLLVPTY